VSLLRTCCILSIFCLLACLEDVRYASTLFPLDSSEYSSPALVTVTTQSMGSGCSSGACNSLYCTSEQFCYDMWRVAECRFTFTCDAFVCILLYFMILRDVFRLTLVTSFIAIMEMLRSLPCESLPFICTGGACLGFFCF
jgi:hypothetical protein